MSDNRRSFIKKSASLAAGVSLVGISGSCGESKKNEAAPVQEPEPKKGVEWPITFGPNQPKITNGISRDAPVETMRKWKQVGVDYVLMNGPGELPWTEDGLKEIIERFEAEGLKVANMYMGGYTKAIYGREGRDEEIENVKKSLRAAGAVDIPIVEYNFYADRLTEGYYEKKGRGGSGMTSFDYEPVKDLPPNPERGSTLTADELWANLSYFLKAIIPVAEEADVRMALHPNDPPAPMSKGSDQIMADLAGWKRLIEIIDSPSNGVTYDCGVTREIGEDPIEVLEYFGSRDRINHIHFRNVTVEVPSLKYTEVFLDEGQVNLFAVMQKIFELDYPFGIYPEHPRGLDYDIEHPEPDGGVNGYPGGGGYTGRTYNIAYTKAMMQAVQSSK